MFFQIHAKFFNSKKGIFSKYEIEKRIPERWRLKSYRVAGISNSSDLLEKLDLPVFGKPEWGQNAHGIEYISTNRELTDFIKRSKKSSISYLIQESSALKNEYEIYFTKDTNNLKKLIIHSIVLSEDNTGNHINSIHSKSTKYKEVLDKFSEVDIEKIKKILKQMGDISVGRVGLKADDISEIVKGNFKVFEINILFPLALKLLAYNVTNNEKKIFMKSLLRTLALLTKNRPKRKYTEVFFKKILLHYKVKFTNNKQYMKLKKIIYKFVESKFLSGCTDYNSLDVRRASRSKFQAREMFAENNIPHAEGLVFLNPLTAYNFVKQKGFPVVLKPNVGGFSRGSHFPINDFKEFWTAMFFVKFWWPKSVVETYLHGKNYRVVTTKGSVDIAMERTPGFVIGNGVKKIDLLIDEENNIREEMGLFPVIHKIEKSAKVKSYLKKHGFSLDSIPKKGEKVFMYHRVSLAPGGVLFTVDIDTITQKNKELFTKILDLFNSNIFGIDVIMEKGIDVDYDKQKTIFLEVNSRAYMKMHEYPRCGNAPDIKPLYDKLDLLEVDGRGLY